MSAPEQQHVRCIEAICERLGEINPRNLFRYAVVGPSLFNQRY